MIVTVTPNPSIDRTITLDRLHRGHVNRAIGLRDDPGGKGVNVSRALAAHGTDTLAILPVGRESATLVSSLLDDAAVRHKLIDLPGAVRQNITVAEADGTTTKINEPGNLCSPEDADAMLSAIDRQLPRATWLVGSGSLPPGLGDDFYSRLVDLARRHNLRSAIDTSGAPFAHVVAAGPDIVKPNHHELTEYAGRELPQLADVVLAAQDIVASGIHTVVVSLGAHGAIAVTADETLHATAEAPTSRSTVAAGDCLLAGYLHATENGANTSDALITAVQWGTASVGLPGSAVPGPSDVSGIDCRLLPGPALHLAMTTD
ncbi:1-phosphofructokinase [Demequina sediminicola]|uniref:1-phosphofructokinase n=1 Tax=Demequina sediminicola TaxID=1095026 RepID=UPI0007842307|nr:1-phosphofructokinase [Demequina sediminicola]